MSVYQKLSKVQSELKAPKGQYNDFGNYHFRSCEDITEAVKPLLSEYGLAMTISDQLKLIGDRYYIEATVTVIDIESNEKHEVNGYAREPENKKGMDLSQITGASSSYARKYALNGMFAIDDTKDADSTNKYGKDKSKGSNGKNSKSSKSKKSEATDHKCDAEGCDRALSEAVVNYCKANSSTFDNRLFCQEHQKAYRDYKKKQGKQSA